MSPECRPEPRLVTMSRMSSDASLIEVRLVGADEYAELKEVRLSALAYSDHLVEHLARESAAPLGFWRDRAERGAAGTTMVTFVAAGESGFAGVADGFLSEDGGTVQIGGMWVSPALRRSGIGRALLGAV
jgi:GNAT superfamily N-acetyltransferase